MGEAANWRRMRAAEPGSAAVVAAWKLPVPLCFHRERKTKMQLHFSSDAVPDSVCSDFQNLNKFTEQVRWQAAVWRVSSGWSALREPNGTSPPVTGSILRPSARGRHLKSRDGSLHLSTSTSGAWRSRDKFLSNQNSCQVCQVNDQNQCQSRGFNIYFRYKNILKYKISKCHNHIIDVNISYFLFYFLIIVLLVCIYISICLQVSFVYHI